MDLIADHLSRLPQQPVFSPYPANLVARLLDESVPATGADAAAVLDEFATRIEPYPFGNGHPRFYGWVNSPPAVIGVFAEALAAAMNPSCAGGNHAAVYVERQVLNWFKAILGFPQNSMGLLVSGGSMATLTALAVACHVKAGTGIRAQGLQRRASPVTVYMGEQGHGCIRKAVELLGIGSDYLRVIPSDGQYRMQVPATQKLETLPITAAATDTQSPLVGTPVMSSTTPATTGPSKVGGMRSTRSARCAPEGCGSRELILSGIDVRTVANRLGHASPSFS